MDEKEYKSKKAQMNELSSEINAENARREQVQYGTDKVTEHQQKMKQVKKTPINERVSEDMNLYQVSFFVWASDETSAGLALRSPTGTPASVVEEVRNSEKSYSNRQCDRCGVCSDEAAWYHNIVNPHANDRRHTDKNWDLCYKCGHAYSEWGPPALKNKNKHWESTHVPGWQNARCCKKAVAYGDSREYRGVHWYCEDCGKVWDVDKRAKACSCDMGEMPPERFAHRYLDKPLLWDWNERLPEEWEL